ncbi:MAG: lysylphosphatidylglycerol synthase transmembrane domain-containing protein [Ilumatobacteraceae bacterium]
MTTTPEPDAARTEGASTEGLAALRVPGHLVEHELATKSLRRRILEAVISLGVIVGLFVFAIPAITGSGYAEIFDAIRQLTLVEFLELTGFWILVMLVYSGVLTSSLPGLTHPQALVLNFAGSAVSNVVPFGGAAGVATTYTMTMSWGLPVPAVTLSILVSGIWNVLTKMAIPIIALTILAVAGRRTAGLVVPTLVGLAVLVGGIVVLTLVLRSEALAEGIGRLAQRFGTRLMRLLRRPPTADWGQAVLDFRHNSIGLIRDRWKSLTMWMLLYNLGQYVLLLMCVRMLGATNDQLGWIEVLAAFAFANILTTVAITPSGVGFVEAGTVAALIAFGGNDVGSAAAVFLFRGYTYLLEIPVGALGWVVWATRHSWRKPVTSSAEPVAPASVGR